MKIRSLKIICFLLTFLLAACSPPPKTNKTNNPFTSGQVSITLKHGKTTKTDVAKVFGAPNIVTMKNGKSTWVYQKNAQVQTSHLSGVFGTIFLLSAANSNVSSASSSRTMTLIIQFDKNDKVSSFKSMTTNF